MKQAWFRSQNQLELSYEENVCCLVKQWDPW